MGFIRWFGISAVELKIGNKIIFIDPLLKKNPMESVNLEGLNADLILITHGARDHMGDAIELAKKTKAMLVGPVDVVTCAIDCGIPEEKTKKMVPGACRVIEGVEFKALHVQHVSFTRCGDKTYTGVPLSYLITLDGGIKLYHTGDTALHGDLKLFGNIYKPDIGLIPVGMFPGAMTEMNPQEAALATAWLKLKLAIPIHFDPDTQAHFPERYKSEIKKTSPQTKVGYIIAGELYEIKKEGKGKITLLKVKEQRQIDD